ncbi:unnamed protein product [Hermetia illucens]|uniref:DNA helicase MCM8 n=1 Tax=Hermetia illucens TaxID=343691 RepID=A0A7R8V7W6_HERIL|nr:DNA helicase MCM8 [Hermetia illucens]CAD7093672.1 unnamed protein product [Hermetia illucens]
MAANPPVGNFRGRGSAANRRGRGRSSWRPYFRRGRGGCGSAPYERPVTLPIPNAGSSSSHDQSTSTVSVSTSLCPVTVQEPPQSFFVEKSSTPYPGWQLYFPKNKYDATSPIVRKVEAIRSHFSRKSEYYDLAKIRKQFWFPLHLSHLTSDDAFCKKWPNFQQDLGENPDETLACIGLAMHRNVSEAPVQPGPSQSVSNSQFQFSSNSCLRTVRARIHGFGPAVNLRALKVNNYDRLVSVRGTVIRAGATQILCTWMAFACPNCNAEQSIRQPEGVFTAPSSCKGGCRTRSNFTELLSSPYTRTEPFQTIRLQESMLGGQYDSGRVPRSIEAELAEDLVDSVCPGDDITLTGILKVRPQEEFQRKGQASMYKIYIRAVSLSNNKNTISNRKSEFTEKDMEAIQLISKEPSPFRLLVNSLCPTIYGHEMVKAGLILGLFGGCAFQPGKRTEAHVLVVGDPGVGKSQMLQACANVSPRGVFVCGNGSSSAGLTVTVRQERGGGSLEAGALVLADQGVCCIDEFDKMSSNHQSLLEVMEQQTVSVAKAGVLCSLPARTCVLAAANPSGGHYDRSKTVSENLKINPALLSRFDLVFILLDRPNAHLDSLLTAHIQALHSGTKNSPGAPSNSGNSSFYGAMNRTLNTSTSSDSSCDKPLLERLRLAPNEKLDLLPHVLFQKYIAYARKNICPKLSTEAAHELKKFYLELRAVRPGLDAIPVTTRQLEALIRLNQARARAELSTTATHRHALDVLEIVRHSLVDVFSTDEGVLQVQRNINGCGMSQASQVKKFLRFLQVRSNTSNKTVFELEELQEIATQAGVAGGLTNILDSLNVQGFLLKKGQSIYKFING